MDRIQRALDLSKTQRLHPAAPDEARLERTTLHAEITHRDENGFARGARLWSAGQYGDA